MAHQVDLVAMAGFGTVMTEAVHRAFPGRILNTHPALLPAFPGWHGVRDALAAGVAETGCTVHIATLEMDAGPILAQEVVPVLPGDTEEIAARADQGGRAQPLPGHGRLGAGRAGGRRDRARRRVEPRSSLRKGSTRHETEVDDESRRRSRPEMTS